MSVYSVNVYPSSTTIKTGNWYYGAYAVVNASSDCNTGVRWYSNNTSVATVNASSGYIYGKAAGTTRIYAQSTVDSSKKDYITVTVTSGTICVDSVTLNRSSISLEKGDRYTLSATVCPTNATNKSISWRSTNTSVATVSGGVVTAKARGYAYIYAEAQDGSDEYDICYVNVTEDILVTSVTVSPSSKTMNIGASAYLYETVCPTNATNKCVRWSSNKTSVATVNPDTGLVIAQGAGTATITATAQDGSGKKGYCTISVNPPVAVTGVEVCPTSLTMSVGDIEYLFASITPSNATNQTVTWCSSDENIATVGLYTGKVTAKKAGTTTITATTADGGCSDSIMIEVKKEFVTIKKDEDNQYFNKMIFKTSNKIWYCMDLDMIFNESNHTEMKLERADLNVWDECGNLRQYSSEEMKLIYAIDPHGFAYYVKERAAELSGLSNILGYKDQIFQLLYQRQPKYFFRDIDGTWHSISKSNVEGSLSSYMSESELIFGTHPVYDISTLYVFVDLIVDTISNLVFSGIGDVIDTIEDVSKLYNLISPVGEYNLNNVISSSKIDGTDLSWIGSVIDIYTTLNNLAENLSSTPNCYLEIFDYCINDTNYDVYIKATNGELIQLKQLHNVMEQLYNS